MDQSAILKVLKCKVSQLASMNLLVQDDSFCNWDSRFQRDMRGIVDSLISEIDSLVDRLA